jgi:hypothetical protein
MGAGQRAWSKELADLARQYFKGVRVAADAGFAAYPLADPCYIRRGWFDSLQTSTTVEKIYAQFDAVVSKGGLFPLVIHQVGPTPSLYCVTPDVVSGALDYLQKLREKGLVRVCTMAEALTPS